MVKALLEGWKTQTRRVLKSQPGDLDRPGMFDDGEWFVTDSRGGHQSPIPVRFRTGDRLWVREAWHAARSLNRTPPRDIPRDADIEYAATARSYAEIGLKGKLRPAMFLPRWASRLTLTVTDVRVQRLQDISADDAEAEGIQIAGPDVGVYRDNAARLPEAARRWDAYRIRQYRAIWETINGAGTWDLNPWVVVLTFEVIKANIDAVPARAAA